MCAHLLITLPHPSFCGEKKAHQHDPLSLLDLHTGEQVWEAVNQVFDRLPLAGVIDNDIFCVHGGFPRPVKGKEMAARIEDILSIPRVAGISPTYDHESRISQQVGKLYVEGHPLKPSKCTLAYCLTYPLLPLLSFLFLQLASDCVWSDPALEDMEDGDLNEQGFGESLRGGGAVCFGNKAVDNFLAINQFSYIVRAHEAHAEGVGLSKGARVFTVFSTSKDHGQGAGAVAGCILVDGDAIRVINRSAKYKNKFVHRRQSATAAGVAHHHMEKAIKLGLVLNVPGEAAEKRSSSPTSSQSSTSTHSHTDSLSSDEGDVHHL